MLALEVAILSEPGGRSSNQDACGHWHSEQQLCCVLADGAGGHGGGDVASRLAVSSLLEAFAARRADDAGALRALVLDANRAIVQRQASALDLADMHSTVVCLVVDFVGHRAYWAHAGDSRLYWFRDGRVVERTRDHSVVQALVDAGILRDDGLRAHPQRSELRSALGSADDELEIADSGAAREVAAGDAFLLCTDGVWEYVDDPTLEALLEDAATPKAWLDGVERAVTQATRAKPTHDNFSAIAVWLAAAEGQGDG
jgi:serine/threonine protein phosphatase PrpC